MQHYDRVLTGGPKEWRDNLRSLAPQTVNLHCDSISQHYAASAVIEWDATMHPYARAPFPVTWVEWNAPSEIRLADGMHKQDKAQYGILCIEKPFNAANRAILQQSHLRCMAEAQRPAFMASIADATLMVYGRITAFIHGRIFAPDYEALWFLREDGYVLNWFMAGYDERFRQLCAYVDSLGSTFGLEWLRVCWLAFSFTNCKNVRLVDIADEVQPPAKIRRRHKIPDVRRVTLEINGHVLRQRRDSQQSEPCELPFHLTRGHFAEYGPERPLFGNPKLIGRFWRPAHARGKKEYGEVLKDYVTGSTEDRATA